MLLIVDYGDDQYELAITSQYVCSKGDPDADWAIRGGLRVEMFGDDL